MDDNQDQQQDTSQPDSEQKEKLERFLTSLKAQEDIQSAIAAGLLAALVGAVLWALITVVTEYQIGFMAIGVGLLVGFAVRYFGKGISTTFGVIGAIASFLGCFIGNILSTAGFVAIAQHTSFFQILSQYDLSTIIEMAIETFNPMDILFYGIAVYEGYRFSFRQVSIEESKLILTEDLPHDFERRKSKNRILLTTLLLVLILGAYILMRTSQGVITDTYPSGNKSAQGLLKGGVPHGQWTFWYENGNVSCEGFFASGREDSLWQWWDSTGSLVRKGYYQRGMMHGQWKHYYPDGSVSESGEYQRNRRSGKWISFYQDGPKQAEYEYSRNHLNGKFISWYPTGQKNSEGEYLNDKPDGVWEYWYVNGQIMEQIEYVDNYPRIRNSWSQTGKPMVVNGTGLYTKYYDEGRKEIEGRVIDGFKNGEWKTWYPDKQIQQIVTYNGDQSYLKSFWANNNEQTVTEGNGQYVIYHQNGNKSIEGKYRNGLSEGEWIYWYEDGSKMQVINYKDGKQHGIKQGWFISGIPSFEGMMVQDIQDGDWKWYYENGQLESMATFKDGKKHGTQSFWNESGVLIKEEIYENGELKDERLP